MKEMILNAKEYKLYQEFLNEETEKVLFLGCFDEVAEQAEQLGLPFQVDALGRVTGAKVIESLCIGDYDIKKVEVEEGYVIIALDTGYERWEYSHTSIECQKCNKLLGHAGHFQDLEIKCPRCKEMNFF